MEKNATYTGTIASESRRSYCDEYIYKDLKAFICGDSTLLDRSDTLSGLSFAYTQDTDSALSDNKDIFSGLSLFGDVVEKINSYAFRPDLRILIISETLEKLLSELDGGFDKPDFLISYLCREVVKNAVLRRFNEELQCECVDLQSLSYKIGDNVAGANKVFLTLRICDPSVRHGIFLRAILNEMIAVKSQLGILADKDGNPLYKYRFVAGETRLNVVDKKEFKAIVLDGSTQESRYIQESLYHEKVALLHNCLFGADKDSLSVLTCKLRLWLDIITNLAGLKDDDLPYIESNIICGDALVSRFTLKDDLLMALRNINQTMADYKRLADSIKTVKESSDRKYLVELMIMIRNCLIEGIGWYSKDTDELLRLRRELSEIMTPGLFPLNETEIKMRNERILLLHTKIKKQENQLSSFRHHQAFGQAVEWRYIFPELLDERGDFIGFDAITGILPDTTVAGLGGEKAGFYKRMNYKVYKNNGNVSDMFCELANRLLVYGGCMSFIMPSNWRRDHFNYKIGEYLNAEMNPSRLILLDGLSSSYDILKGKCALVVYKDINRHNAIMCHIDNSYNPRIIDLGEYIQQYAIPIFRLVESGEKHVKESISTIIASNTDYINISNKIKSKGLMIKNWDVSINSGIMTGCDEAFFVNKAIRDELIHVDYKNSEIIKPLLAGDFIKRYGDGIPEQWLLYIPWHFPLQYDKTINAASMRAEQRFQMQYPDVYNHLLKHKDTLSTRNTVEIGLRFEWYALQRSGMKNNWEDFSNLKIVWKRDSADFNFGIDYGGCAVLDDTCFMSGQHLKFLLGVFNSTMGRYILSDLSRLSINESQAGVFVVESVPVPVPNGKMESDVITFVNRRISENNKSDEEKRITEEQIDRLIFELYELTEDEISFIKAQDI